MVTRLRLIVTLIHARAAAAVVSGLLLLILVLPTRVAEARAVVLFLVQARGLSFA